MAVCHRYRDMQKSRPTGATEITDENLMNAVRSHATPKWWDTYRYDPDRYAYIRRWGSVIRREARKRGLLEGGNYE